MYVSYPPDLVIFLYHFFSLQLIYGQRPCLLGHLLKEVCEPGVSRSIKDHNANVREDWMRLSVMKTLDGINHGACDKLFPYTIYTTAKGRQNNGDCIVFFSSSEGVMNSHCHKMLTFSWRMLITVGPYRMNDIVTLQVSPSMSYCLLTSTPFCVCSMYLLHCF